jgi:hypothetical protein
MDLDAMIVQINQEWTRLENRKNELSRELSEVSASMERLGAIKAAAQGKIATSPRKSKGPSSGGKRWSGTPEQIRLRREIVALGQRARRVKGQEKMKLEKEKESLRTKLAALRKG